MILVVRSRCLNVSMYVCVYVLSYSEVVTIIRLCMFECFRCWVKARGSLRDP